MSAFVLADLSPELLPAADGGDDSASWSTGGGTLCNSTNCYTEVDDTSGSSCTNSDGDSTYIKSSSSNAVQTFDIEESSIPNGSTITQIAVTICAKRGQPGATLQTRYCYDSTCFNSGATIASGSQYSSYTQNHATNFIKQPGTDIEIGLINIAPRESRISRISAIITYTPPVPVCGDGSVDAGETCDSGVNNGQVCVPPYGGTCTYCSSSCQTVQLTGPYCGDGIENGSEECDDGNNINGDGCSSSCVIETPPATCGDSSVDAGEECDEGINNGQICIPAYNSSCFYCSGTCQLIQLTGPYCGDNIINGNENCDDGNANNGDGCSSSCYIEGQDIPTPLTGGTTTRRIGVVFSGQAYPGSKIEVLRRSPGDAETVYLTIPVETHVVSEDGKFYLNLGALVNDEYFLALRAEDKDGRKTSVIAFDVDLRTTNLLEVKDIFFQPTFEFNKEVVSRGQSLEIFGYAAPNADIEIELGSFVLKTAKADADGFWFLALGTDNLSSGQYSIKIKQADASGKTSRSTAARTFRVSLLKNPEIDFNNDDTINIIDWSVFLYRWGSEDNNLKKTIDLNIDGQISVQDFSIFLDAMKI